MDIMTKSLSLLLSKSQDASSAPGGGGLLNMSKTLASFHLTGKKLMDTSVDQLFRAGEDVFTAPPPSSSSEMGGGAQQQGGPWCWSCGSTKDQTGEPVPSAEEHSGRRSR